MLDPSRKVTVVAGTPGEDDCGRLAEPGACAIVADLLGEGVVWFALVPMGNWPQRPAAGDRLARRTAWRRSSTVGSCRTPPALDRRCGERAVRVVPPVEADPRRQLHDDLRHRSARADRRRVPPGRPLRPAPGVDARPTAADACADAEHRPGVSDPGLYASLPPFRQRGRGIAGSLTRAGGSGRVVGALRARCAASARPRNSSRIRLNVVACSIMNPWAAPLITTSSAVGIRSASSSASPRGVRMSWLPTITSVGTLDPARARPPGPPGRRGSRRPGRRRRASGVTARAGRASRWPG